MLTSLDERPSPSPWGRMLRRLRSVSASHWNERGRTVTCWEASIRCLSPSAPTSPTCTSQKALLRRSVLTPIVCALDLVRHLLLNISLPRHPVESLPDRVVGLCGEFFYEFKSLRLVTFGASPHLERISSVRQIIRCAFRRVSSEYKLRALSLVHPLTLDVSVPMSSLQTSIACFQSDVSEHNRS